MSLRRALLVAACRLFAKPVLRRSRSPVLARQAFRLTARLAFRTPPLACCLPRRLGRCEMLEVTCGPADAKSAMLYFHGGGYVVGSPETHAGMLAALAARSGLRIFAPRYRLAPEDPIPAQFEDAHAAWTALIATGYRPQDIVIGGDSAGGGLALALLASLCQAGSPPAGAVLLSPWTDLSAESATPNAPAGADPLLPRQRLDDLRAMVLGGADGTSPVASPVRAAFPDLPPVFLQFSSAEILNADIHRMAAHLQSEGGPVVVDEWPGLPHVWALFAGWLPEADEALDRIAEFMRQMRSGPTTDDS